MRRNANGQEPGGLPLSPIQQGFLAESLASSDRGVNVEQVVGELDETLDVEAFEAAWQHAVSSFDAFRLRLTWSEDGPPRQSVLPSLPVSLEVVDVEAGESAQGALEAFLAKDRARGFDLSQAPLMRVTVIRMGGARWAFVWTVHHTIIDGGSYANVIRFVFAAYERLRAGEEPAAWTAPAFRSFVEWLSEHDARPGVEHFRKLLEGFDELPDLPYQSGSRAEPSGRHEETRLELTVAETEAVKSAAREAEVTPNTVLQLAWGVLLARYCGRDDVVFGATWSGRPGTIEGARDVVGPLINTLPVRIDLGRGPSVRRALQELREQHLALRPHQHASLQDIKAASELAGSAQLFETLFVFEYERFFSVLEREEARWKRGRLWSRSHTSLPLGLSAHAEQGRMVLVVDYDTGLYERDRARELLENYARLVAHLCQALDEDVHALRMLDPDVFRRLTEEQVAREHVGPEPSVLARVRKTAAVRPEATAIEEMGGRRTTYGELTMRVDALARRLVERGVRPGDIVGILAPRSIEALASMLAIHAAGAAFLPLDPGNPEHRLDFMVRDSGARLVLVDGRTDGTLEAAEGLTMRVDQLDDSNGSDDLPSDPTPPGGLAYVIYTSGSTGQPKGVCVPHSAMANHATATVELFGLGPEDRALQFMALSFDASLEEIFPTLIAGATLVVRSDEISTSARGFFEAVEQHGITVANLPTAFWHQMVYAEVPWPHCVRLLVIGGEQASASAHACFRAAVPFRTRFLNGYGPTETTVTSTMYDDAAGDHSAEELPIGEPCRGLSHFALDRHMRPVPPGAVGQLYIGGAGLALGYLRREELTAEKFVPHPWRPDARLYATGDLVRQTRRGNYVYLDRVDNQVKIRGFRIELGEIEARLGSHPGVAEVVVVADREPGGEARLVAFAVARNGATPELLRRHLASTLPTYMVPAEIRVAKDLPKTPSGKVDRRALARRAAASAAPEVATAGDGTLEDGLLRIWSDLLKTTVSDPGANFFELGGNSLVAVQMFTRVEKQLGKTCKVTEFFKEPTVRALRRLIESHDGTDWKSPRLQLAAGGPGALPIFLAPSVTGRAIDYAHLGGVLGREFPVYALQIRGLSEGEAPHEDLASAAEHYADLMQEVQPRGPYAVMGFSAGGIIALAIAEVLHERGESTALVAVLDSVPTVPARSPFTSWSRFRRLLRTVRGRLAEFLAGPDALSRLWARTRSAVRRGAARWLPTPMEYEARVEGLFVGVNVELSEAETALMQKHLDVVLAHEPKHYPIDLVLFRTHLDPFEGPHEPDLAWSRAVTGRVAIDVLPCLHHELLTRDGAPRLVELMRPHLARLSSLRVDA